MPDGENFNDQKDLEVERMALPRTRSAPLMENFCSTYAVEVARKAKDWADAAITVINHGNPESAQNWKRAADDVPKGKKKSPLGWLEDNAPDQFVRVNTAYTNVVGESLR